MKTNYIDFYKGKFKDLKPYIGKNGLIFKFFLLLSISQREIKLLNNIINKNSFILDIGCGGGHEILKYKGRYVIGVDIDLESLKVAKSNYDAVIRADVRHLPFKDDCFDYIVATHLFEHLYNNDKPKFLKEVKRLLKMRATFVCVFPCDESSVLNRLAKRFPDLYKKYFILLDGHFGFESAPIAVKRFKTIFGSKNVSYSVLTYGSFRACQEYLKRFDNEYITKSLIIRVIVLICKIFNINLFLRSIFNIIMGPLELSFRKFKGYNLEEAHLIACICKK